MKRHNNLSGRELDNSRKKENRSGTAVAIEIDGVEVVVEPGAYSVDSREQAASAMRPTMRRVCIVMACADAGEADLVSRQLEELNSACLVTYRRAEDLMYGLPTGKVALFILATADTPAVIGKTLSWLRRRWPRCPVLVIGDAGGGDGELTARKGGAYYMTRPVNPQQWNSILTHALQASGSSRTKKRDSWLEHQSS